MLIYGLIEWSANYVKTSEGLWHYLKDDPNHNITDSDSFKFKTRITRTTTAVGNSKDVQIVLPLKYSSNFMKTIEKLLINCDVNLMST